jgi:hypothetical protein
VLVHEKEISFLGSGSVNGGVSVLSCAGGWGIRMKVTGPLRGCGSN